MKLTAQEIHTYNDLVKKGLVDPLSLPGASDDAILITKIDDYDQVYFFDLVENINIYPGRNTIEKIKNALAMLDKA